MEYDAEWIKDEYYKPIPKIHAAKTGIIPKGRKRSAKLTRNKLMQREDWDDWKASETKQLNQYEQQKMFGSPMKPPPGANVLPFLWTYLIKDDDTKKARCVCNGAPSKGTVTLGPTYAGSLDQTGARIFWATAVLHNLKVYGADVSNAFAEAPPPVAPLYITVDKQYQDWYKAKGYGTIPDGHVIKANRALQGHPESARQWALLIDRILRTKLNLKPTTHEPCLYSGTHDGIKIFFLRQVDDFAIACPDESIAKSMIDKINQFMQVQIKYLGLLTRYNGVDVLQTREYIKIYNSTYINKILKGHQSWMEERYCANMPIPMKSEQTFIRQIEKAVPPNNDQQDNDASNLPIPNEELSSFHKIFEKITCDMAKLFGGKIWKLELCAFVCVQSNSVIKGGRVTYSNVPILKPLLATRMFELIAAPVKDRLIPTLLLLPVQPEVVVADSS